ncbi:MAG: methyltransferase domain-containing protein [Dehalococcoidia bacterium]|nr:methyltransferase domain-containing protein [Dehalococcoidia bacterium]
MDIIYEPETSYRRALQIDRMWADSDAGAKLCAEILNIASLKGDETALDAACGSGLLLQALAEALPNGRAIGVDCSPAMVRLSQAKLARLKNGRAAVMYSEGADLIFKASAFDVVFCMLGLYHFSNPLAALKEMKRVLKKGGRLVLCEYEAPADPELRATLTESFQLAHPGYRFYTGPELYALVSEAGLSRQRSATQRFTFDEHGIGGLPLGVHFFETRFMLQKRGDQNLLASFDGNVFRPVGRMMHPKGALDFMLVRAVK